MRPVRAAGQAGRRPVLRSFRSLLHRDNVTVGRVV
jgi:hypothetical protein